MTTVTLPIQVTSFVISQPKSSISCQGFENEQRFHVQSSEMTNSGLLVDASQYSSPKTKSKLYGQKQQSSAEGMARKLKEEAEKLRSEVNQFEQGKKDAVRRVEKEKEIVLEAKKNRRLRYSAEVPILKGDGNVVVEQVDFPPVMLGEDVSEIIALEASLPLGMILGEHEKIVGAVQVDEILEGSNADLAGIIVGDILRACTACQVTMTQPTWQLIAGGIGQPKTTRFMFSADKKPFEEIMDAIGSNRMDPSEQPLCLVMERKS